LQFSEAAKQRKAADNALKQAEIAMEVSLRAGASAEHARDEARKTIELLRMNVRFMLERDYLTTKLITESSDVAGAERVSRKLEEFAVPNEKERKEWLESLKQRRSGRKSTQ